MPALHSYDLTLFDGKIKLAKPVPIKFAGPGKDTEEAQKLQRLMSGYFIPMAQMLSGVDASAEKPVLLLE